MKKKNQLALNSAIDAINKGISTNSLTLSKVFRNVCFALLAFVWGLLIKEGPLLTLNANTIIFFLLMIAYFIIDILQYFIVLSKYIKHGDNFEYLFNLARNNITQVLEDEKIERKRINKISYGFFYAKAIIMFAALAFFLIIIINVLL